MSEPTQNIEEIVAQLFVLPNTLGLAAILGPAKEQAATLPEEYRVIFSAYESTLERLGTTVLLPYRMAWLGEANVHQERIAHVAMIQALDRLDPLKEDLDVAALPLREEIARTLFAKFLHSDDGTVALRSGAVKRLEWSTRLDKGRMVRAGQDLLLQSIVVAWAAFETFVEDTVRAILNDRPELVRLLLADEDAKRRVSKGRWNVAELLDFGPSIARRFGDLVLSENDLSDYASIKALLLPIFRSPSELRKALNDPSLFLLSKLRNVIAHRGGIADARFEADTGGRWKRGETVTVTPGELAEYLRATLRVVQVTIDELRRMTSRPLD
jgi:hypothetical protein